ncbi:hypothetical protein J6590_048783 [Homalodisca vitripennis]|nr:hypothetical protein J6590_048783 [Homalodisca vitripennis]
MSSERNEESKCSSSDWVTFTASSMAGTGAALAAHYSVLSRTCDSSRQEVRLPLLNSAEIAEIRQDIYNDDDL